MFEAYIFSRKWPKLPECMHSRVEFVYDNLLKENMTNKKLKMGNHYFVMTGILHKQYKLYVYYTMYMQVFQ